jgi:hypothetical protein
MEILITGCLCLPQGNNMQIYSEKIESILRKGICFQQYGISNWGFSKNLALSIVEEFNKLNIGILGGDVFIIENNTIIPTYDNWYTNKDNENFVELSIFKAKNYIKNYYYKNNVYFVFVLDVKSG